MAFEIIYTELGLEKLVSAENGTPLVFEKFAVGDGENPPSPEQTALQNEKWRGFINEAKPSSTNPTNLLVTCVVPAQISETEAFYIRELGLFAKTGELIAIAKVPDSYYAQSDSGVASEKLYNLVLTISNTAEIALQLDSTIYATEKSVEELKAELENAIAQVQQIEKSKQGNLSKLSDGNFSLTTNCKRDTGKDAKLYNGLKITFIVPLATAVWNYQNTANPTLAVDGLGSKPLINGLWYEETGHQALDRNTVCSGKQYVEYAEDIDSWLLYHTSYTSTQIYYKTSNQDLAGFLKLNGQRLSAAGTNLLEQYPLYSKTPWIYQDTKDDSTQVINLTSTAIVAAGGETPYGVISQGQIKNIVGSAFKGTGNALFSDGATGDQDSGTGVFSALEGKYNGGLGMSKNVTSWSWASFDFDASRVVKTGNETLTRRFGLYPFLKL